MQITDGGVPVDALITVVKNSIRSADADDAPSIPDAPDAPDAPATTRRLRVTAVNLTLCVMAERTSGGSLELRVPFLGMPLRFGVRVSRQDTHTLQLTLVPAEAPAARELLADAVEDTLVEAIATIRQVMTQAAAGDQPWRLQTGSVELAFAITKDGSITLGLDHDHTDEVTHTLSLTLAESD